MQYLTLLYDAEANANEYGSPEFAEEMAGYQRFGELAAAAILGGEALMPADTTRTVHPGDGSHRVTAGPFAETTEVLGGFYVLEADTLDDVIELARHIPAARTGSIEIRPLVQWIDATGRDASPAGGTRWMCTLHGEETSADDPADPQWAAAAEEHGHFGSRAGAAVLAAGAVQPQATATTIRVRDDELLVADGPPAHITPLVGGVYLLAADDDSILDLAAAIPVGAGGAIEVRPVMELDG
jgi:hypothetical protein